MQRLLVVTRLLVICLVPIAMALVPMRLLDNARPICLYTISTGSECWGCGMTRALCAAVRGEFFEAFAYNPRVTLVLPVLFLVWMQLVRRHVRLIVARTREAPLTGASR